MVSQSDPNRGPGSGALRHDVQNVDGHDTQPPARARAARQRTEARIVDAALDVFSSYGFRGTTLEQIARNSGLPKANLLYYFPSKKSIYLAVLESTLKLWLEPLQAMNARGEPQDEIWCYIEAKLALSRKAPAASRLFANEILAGAPMIRPYLATELRELVDSRCAILQTWIDQGRLAPVEPLNLLFLIWAATQHYADFEAQIRELYDGSEQVLYEGARRTLWVLLKGGLAGAVQRSN